jgi:alpha-ribazole phosphatase/probable phosphoglycerate mutase
MHSTTIDLLRHGDVESGTRLLGQSDLPLSELGWTQLRAVVDGTTPPWEHIISSPLQRCANFAVELADRHGLPLVYEKRLMEINFGTWNGRLFSDLYAQEGVAMRRFWDNPAALAVPGGESYPAFETRVATAWNEILETYRGRHCLMLTHGGVIRAILRQVLKFPVERMFQIEVPYACLTRLQQHEELPPRLVFHGGTP